MHCTEQMRNVSWKIITTIMSNEEKIDVENAAYALIINVNLKGNTIVVFRLNV